jgi:hypothetical protein
MTEVLTRSAVDVFAPVDGSGNARGADMGEAQQWGVEIENLLGTDFDGGLYTWDTGTTDADPGTGKIRANNASLASATVLYISKTSRAGSSLAAFLAALDDASNPVKGTLILTKRPTGTQATFNVGVVTDASDYIKLAISNPSGETGFPASSIMSFQFSRSGDNGTNGTNGTNGVNAGVIYAFSNSTSMGDPTNGFLRFNNATFSSITALAISANSNASTNPSVSAWLNTFDDSSTAAHRGLIIIKKISAQENYVTLDVTAALTDNTSWKQLTVAYVSGNGSFSDVDALTVEFYRTGNAGAGSGDMLAANKLDEFSTESDKSDARNNIGLTRDYLVPSQGRLTLTAGVPILGSDVLTATSIYCSPLTGKYLPIYNGTSFVPYNFLTSDTDTTGLSLALDSSSGHTNYHQSAKNYDIFVAYVSGVVYFGTGPKWDDGASSGSDTARGTGAASTELQSFRGIYTNKNSMTLRYGSASGNTVTVPANQGTYLGSVRMSANGQTEMSLKPTAASGGTNNKIYLWNAYNMVPFEVMCRDSGTWNYKTFTWRAANSSSSNRISFLSGLGGLATSTRYAVTAQPAGTSADCYIGVNLNSTTAGPNQIKRYNPAGVSGIAIPIAAEDAFIALGHNYVQAMEIGNGTDGMGFESTALTARVYA